MGSTLLYFGMRLGLLGYFRMDRENERVKEKVVGIY